MELALRLLLTVSALFGWSILLPTFAPPVWVRISLPARGRLLWLIAVAAANLSIVVILSIVCSGWQPALAGGVGLLAYFAMARPARRVSLWLLSLRPVRSGVGRLWRRPPQTVL